MIDFKLPEVGENIESGTVINIMVSVGDTVTKDQDLFELETEKASLPVPSPAAGVVKEILIKEGEEINVGSIVMRIEADAAAVTPPVEEEPPKNSQTPQPISAQPAPTPTPGAAASVQSKLQEAIINTDQHVVVIGAGPGGYVAAFHAADLGLKVTLIEKEKNLGGVCNNCGCIPSKALLHAAKIINESREAKNFGIEFKEPKIDLDKLRGWKDGIINKLSSGLNQLTTQRKINRIMGTAEFTSSQSVNITKADGSKEEIKFDKAIIATGSSPIDLPFAPKSPRVLNSTSALEIENIPKSLLLIGGGYIGLELGQVYAELGSKVSVVELLPQLMTGADRDIASVLEKKLKTIMDKIMVETKVKEIKETSKGISVTFEDKAGKSFKEEYEKILVAVGRKPNSKGLGLENTKVNVNDKGFIEANDQLQTSDPSIYAIGDVNGNPMLAHKASHEGRVAAEHITGQKVAFDPKAIPAVVFTDPEIAWAGLTETEAKNKNIQYTVAKFPWAASGRARTLDRTDGLTKLLIDPHNERILGVSIVGAGAGELIAEGVLAIEMGAVAADLKLSIHPHPTLSETIMESAEGFYGLSTHIYKPKRK